MDEMIEYLVKNIISGGSGAVISILLIIIVCLIYIIRKMTKTMEAKDDKNDKIINDYYRITLQVSETIKSLKEVLLEIRSKL